jgi:hypothetical protein
MEAPEVKESREQTLVRSKALIHAIGLFFEAADQYLDKRVAHVSYLDQPDLILERCLEKASKLRDDLGKAVAGLE